MDSDTPTWQITIRPAESEDLPRVRRLAALDSAPAPRGPVLLAEVDGELQAALAVADGRVVADPFAHTTALVDLLRGYSRTPARKRHRIGTRGRAAHRRDEPRWNR